MTQKKKPFFIPMSRKKKTLISLCVLFSCCLLALKYYVEDYRHWIDLDWKTTLAVYGTIYLGMLFSIQYIKRLDI